MTNGPARSVSGSRSLSEIVVGFRTRPFTSIDQGRDTSSWSGNAVRTKNLSFGVTSASGRSADRSV